MPEPRSIRFALITIALLLGCTGDDPTDPGDPTETGSVEASVATTGADLDEVYSVTVADSTREVQANGSVTFADVPVGDRTVELGDVAENCAVTDSSTRTVTVVAGDTATASFAVVCEAVENPDDVLAEANVALEDAMFAALDIESVDDLDAVSFQEAHDLFARALELSPSNDTAAFGVAVTTIFILEDDGEVRAVADEWDAWLQDGAGSPLAGTLLAPPTPLRWDRTTLPLDFSGADVERLAHTGLAAHRLADAPALAQGTPPSLASHQTVLTDVVRPTLEAALDAIAAIDDPAFVFTITERMQGEDPADADPLELDYTEVLAVRAGIEVALASIGVATAYVLEPNPLDVEGFVDAMTPGSTFLTLASGGGAGLAEALDRLHLAVDVLRDGLDNLEAETDDQTDDIIKYDPAGAGDGLTAQDIADARDVIDDVDAALSGPTTVTIDEGEPDEVTFTLDAREFFVDPIQDFKAMLPGYEVFTATEESETVVVFRWTALNPEDWTFPDPTFSGILPDMATTQDLNDVIESLADEIFFELSLAGGYYTLITIDDVDCVENYDAGGQGCPVGDDHYHHASIDLAGEFGMSEVYFTLAGTSSTGGGIFTDAFGSYTVADDGGGSYSVTMDMTDDSDAPLVLNGTLLDRPGYSSVDSSFRTRGGSSITVSYLGSEWVFEKQY